MLQERTGDILRDDAQALVNTVNTVGVMGKGIALQFKRRFPGNFKAYRRACEAGEVEPGRMFVWPTEQLSNPQYIINFPTKRHWKGRSRIDDIEAGLRDLQRVVAELQLTSIAVPPLGCGQGGLLWSEVGPLIASHLSDLPGIDVRLYTPNGAPEPATMAAHPTAPRLTPHRAAMVIAFSRYLRPGFTLGRLEAQKLLYFLQVAGAPFAKLHFNQGPYGPYADGVRHVLNDVEGHLIRGFGDADARSKIRPIESAVAEAEVMLDWPGNQAFRDAVDAVADFTAGFDDAFGLELLASVHWLASHGDPPAQNVHQATQQLQDWSHRKRRRYDSAHVRAAWRRLQEAGLVEATEPEPVAARRNDPQPEMPVVEPDLIAL